MIAAPNLWEKHANLFEDSETIQVLPSPEKRHHAPGLLDEPPILVYPNLARLIGINEAVILQQVHYLINGQRTAKNKYNYVNDRWWVYNTYKEWRRDHFPWLSEASIKRILRWHEKNGYLVSMQSVKNKSDRRKWYSIDYTKWTEFLKTMGSKRSHQPWDQKDPMVGSKRSDGYSKTPSKRKKNTTAPESAVADATPMRDRIIAILKRDGKTNTTKLVNELGREVQIHLHALVHDGVVRDSFQGYALATEDDAGKPSEVDTFIEGQQKADAQPDYIRTAAADVVPMIREVQVEFNVDGWKSRYMAEMLLGKARRKPWKDCNLETPFTVEDVKPFVAHYRKTELGGDLHKPVVQNAVGLQSAALVYLRSRNGTNGTQSLTQLDRDLAEAGQWTLL